MRQGNKEPFLTWAVGLAGAIAEQAAAGPQEVGGDASNPGVDRGTLSLLIRSELQSRPPPPAPQAQY